MDGGGCDLSLGNFRRKLSLGNFCLEPFACKLSFGIFRLGTFDWELSFWEISLFTDNALFVCTCLLVLVVVLVKYGGGTRRKLFGE